MQFRPHASLAAAAILAAALPCAAQPAFTGYGAHYRPIAMPPTALGSTGLAGGALPDGRIVAVTGLNVLRETAAGSGTFDVVATLDAAAMGGGTDPAFLRVSPDGGRIAVGGGFGRPIAVFDAAALGTAAAPTALSAGVASYFDAQHYDAAWADGSRLALTAGDFGSPSVVTLLDVTSSPAAPSNRTILTNIGGSPGGIAFDSAGRLYTGNGYDVGPGGSTTGTLRAFDASITIGGAAPADFETAGVLVGQVLSASSLAFDPEGNLFVGGGNFGEMDVGYLGVLSASALSDVLAGLGAIDPSDALHLRRLMPTADPFAFYGSVFNPATGELYITATDFAAGMTVWYATVPAPAGAAVLALSGLLAARRRRNA